MAPGDVGIAFDDNDPRRSRHDGSEGQPKRKGGRRKPEAIVVTEPAPALAEAAVAVIVAEIAAPLEPAPMEVAVPLEISAIRTRSVTTAMADLFNVCGRDQR